MVPEPSLSPPSAPDRARRLVRAINATGVVVHDDLGRAPLSFAAMTALCEEARGYCQLAIDRETASRATRYRYCEEILSHLTGAEAALIVVNDAAALFLVLGTLAAGREVVIARPELVEIDESLWIADLISGSGASAVEAGAANRVRIEDYEAAISERTGLILRVVPGGVCEAEEEVSTARLVDLGRRTGVPVVEDLGMAGLVDAGGPDQPAPRLLRSSVEAGADLVLASADERIGGPQAGLVVGRREWIDRLHRNPLYRAFRTGKLTLIALEATLAELSDPARDPLGNEAIRMLSIPAEELEHRARAIAEALGEIGKARIGVAPGSSLSGGGREELGLPTFLVTVKPVAGGAEDLARALRRRSVPVLVRTGGEALLLDPRTVFPDDAAELVRAVREELETESV